MKKLFLLAVLAVAVYFYMGCDRLGDKAPVRNESEESCESSAELTSEESKVEEKAATAPVAPAPEESPQEPVAKEYTPTELEAEGLRLINAEREKAGLAPLSFATEIYDCAKTRTEEILVCWSHTRPNGQGFRTVYEEAGFNWKKYWTGENIAGNFKTMEQVTEALMNSDGHRANLLCPEYKSVALCVLPTQDGKYYYMAQLFLG